MVVNGRWHLDGRIDLSWKSDPWQNGMLQDQETPSHWVQCKSVQRLLFFFLSNLTKPPSFGSLICTKLCVFIMVILRAHSHRQCLVRTFGLSRIVTTLLVTLLLFWKVQKSGLNTASVNVRWHTLFFASMGLSGQVKGPSSIAHWSPFFLFFKNKKQKQDYTKTMQLIYIKCLGRV